MIRKPFLFLLAFSVLLLLLLKTDPKYYLPYFIYPNEDMANHAIKLIYPDAVVTSLGDRKLLTDGSDGILEYDQAISFAYGGMDCEINIGFVWNGQGWAYLMGEEPVCSIANKI